MRLGEPAQLVLLALTSVALVATSEASVCAPSALNVRAVTSCGPEANVSLTLDTECAVAASGADVGGLPSTGFVLVASDAGLGVGFTLRELDAGVIRSCVASPADGGFDLLCTHCPTDGGSCVTGCGGSLTPQ